MEKVYIVGKSSDCDIVIQHPTVSRQHAQLIVQEMIVEIIDLDSTNGTLVNGEKITIPRRLFKEDKVVLGACPFDWQNYITVQPLLSDTQDNPVEKKEEKVAAMAAAPEESGPSRKRIMWVAASFIVIIGVAVTLTFALPGGIFGASEEDEVAENDSTSTEVVEPGEPDYDFSCLENDEDGGSTEIINVISDIEGTITDMYGEEVTVEEELEFGKEVLAEMDVSDHGPQYTRISRIKKKLVAAIPEGSEYVYDIHLVEEDEINAFTCGGQIFVYTGIIDFCENDNELAAIIAHEIAHNELGHIKRKLSQIKSMGELTAAIYMTVTMAFGQKLETHCDLWGIDLAIKAGYSGCNVVDVWDRMEDSEYNVGESMIRSHPFSSQRADCCAHHLDSYHPGHCK